MLDNIDSLQREHIHRICIYSYTESVIIDEIDNWISNQRNIYDNLVLEETRSLYSYEIECRNFFVTDDDSDSDNESSSLFSLYG